MFPRPIFRTKSFERLTSPEKLDELLKVTSSRSWLILVSLILVILIILMWSFWGTITSKAEGTGLFNHPNHELAVHCNCQIDTLLVNAGDRISKGQLVAKILPEEAVAIIANYHSQLWLLQKNQSPDYDNGFEEINNKLNNYLKGIESRCMLTSPVDGIIAEIKTNEGSFLESNSTILTIQKWENNTESEVLFFIKGSDITRVRKGMKIAVSITNTKGNNRFAGEILNQPGFPASFERLMAIFNNESLVKELILTNPYELKGRIDPFPGMTIHEINENNGRICRVEVIIEKKSPISLLFKK